MAAISVTAANVERISGATKTVTAGATLTAGQPVYRDITDGNLYKPAINTSNLAANVEGIALGGASRTQKFVIQTSGEIDIGATTALGHPYGIGDAAGEIVEYDTNASSPQIAAGEFGTFLGVGLTTDGRVRLKIKASGKAVA